MQIDINTIPEINKHATVAEVAQIFDEMLKEADPQMRFSCEIVGDTISFVLSMSDQDILTETLSSSFFKESVFYPMFHFCTAHIDPNIEEQTINHWEFLYLIVRERVENIARNERPWMGLLRRDIKNLVNYCKWTMPESPNAVIKAKSEVILFEPYDPYKRSIVYIRPDAVIGDAIFTMKATNKKAIEEAVRNFFSVIPGSESSLSKNGSLCVSDFSNQQQSACGFQIVNMDGVAYAIKSIFPAKSQLPARLKTHLNGNCMLLLEHSKSVFLQDLKKDENGNWVSKRNVFISAVVKFSKIDGDTFRFGAGEIEVGPQVSDRIVYSNRHIETEMEYVIVKEGQSYNSKNGYVEFGYNFDENGNKRKVYIDGVHSVKIKKVGEIGNNNVRRIEYIAYYQAGNCRIISHSGLKGVTKTIQNAGYIEYERDGKTERIDVDMIAGPNSTKAEMNTVRLAQAALAFKLGFYQNGKEYLDSMSEQEINAAAASLPKGNFFRSIGTNYTEDEEDCTYGLVEVMVTEIGSTYARIQDQILPFNAWNILCSAPDENTKRLVEILKEQCFNGPEIDIALELAKCYNDHTSVLNVKDRLPVYTLEQLPKVFNEGDLIRSLTSLIPFTSKLLDPEFNKGFYIHMAPHRRGMHIRVPPADVLNCLCGQQTDGMYSYPGLLLELSSVIENSVKGSKWYFAIVPHVREDNQNRPCAVANYFRQIGSMLYSNEIGGQVYVKKLINPTLSGINLKQVHDQYLPEDTVVILDTQTLSKIRYHIYSSEEDDAAQAIANAFKEVYGFGLRNPFLWRNQTQVVRVWGEEEFDDHLQRNFGFSLRDYLYIPGNRFCALVPTSVIKNSHGDSDGDLLQLMFVAGEEGQHCLKNFEVPYRSEIGNNWDQEYLDGEIESNDKFDSTKQYKLNVIPMLADTKGQFSYVGTLCDSAIAKSAVGPGTNNAWLFYMISELYAHLYKTEDERSWLTYNGQRKRIAGAETFMHPAFDAYIELLQERVVTAIKHMAGGSSTHGQFLLKRLGTDNKNMKKVVDIIFQDHKYPRNIGSYICAIANWAVLSGALDMCDKFLKMHNKGQVVKMDNDTVEWFDLISKYTTFGKMLAPIFQIVRVCSGRESIDDDDDEDGSQSSAPIEIVGI